MNKLNLRSRVDEVNGVAISLQNAYAASGITDEETLQAIFDELKAEQTVLNVAIEKDRISSELEHYDEIRDEALRDFFYFLNGMRRVSDSLTVTSANHLLSIFQKYGVTMLKKSYLEETSAINSLLVDYSTAESQEAMTALPHTASLFENIKTSQADFEGMFNKYKEELAKNTKNNSASELKPKVLNIINTKLLVYLRSLAMFQKETYGAFATQISIIINGQNQNIRERFRK